MINNSVYENQISRLKTKIIEAQAQLIIYLTRGNPDNYTKRILLDIASVQAEIRKVSGEHTTEASVVGLAKEIK